MYFKVIKNKDHKTHIVLNNKTLAATQAFNGLSHDELMTLATCYSEGEVTNYRLQIIIDKHSADITKLLKALCDKGFLTSYGFGRGTKYQINEEYELSSLQNDDSSFKNDDSGFKNDDSGKKKKASQKLRDAILAACEEYTSVEDIAIKVGKSISHLKNRVLPRMIEDQLLERLYPDALKHPRQKYRARK